MKTLLDYCYYRISKAYKIIEENGYYASGSLILFGSFGFIFLSLLAFVFSIFKMKFNPTIIGTILCLFIIISLFFINKKKYEELEQHYKDEKYSKLKGWLIFLYVVGSVVLFFVSINVFDV